MGAGFHFNVANTVNIFDFLIKFLSRFCRKVYQPALPSLDVPVGIALSDLATAVFRASGLSPEAARAAGLAYAISPAWLLRVSAEDSAVVRRLSLRNGEAWLIGESSPDGQIREVMLMRTSASRLYVVTSTNDEQAIAVAEALP